MKTQHQTKWNRWKHWWRLISNFFQLSNQTAQIVSKNKFLISWTLQTKQKRKRCILDKCFKKKLGVSTTQRTASKELQKFDVLLCGQWEGWKIFFRWTHTTNFPAISIKKSCNLLDPKISTVTCLKKKGKS